VLLVASTFAEAFPVPIIGVKAGSTSLATIAIAATGALYSWPLAAFVGLLTMLLVEVRRRKPAIQVAYNSALYTLAGAAAGLVSAASPYRTGVPGSAAFYLVDIALLAAVVARVGASSYWTVLRGFLASTVTPFLVIAATTGILVELWARSPFLALLLVPPLFAIARYQRSLHAAMERQRELDRLKEDFVAVVSHELRTPLATVYGGVETLQRRSLPDEARARLFAVIRQEATRLAKLVDDVLWASRLDARREPNVETHFDAPTLIAEVVAAARETAPVNLELAVAVDQPLRRVAADRDHTQRVLANLIENAVKYSPDGGTVTVGATTSGDSVRFTVRDEGIGIPAGERERVFEKFTRLDPQMTRGIGGTGLGLYICKQLVENMRGRIWVEAAPGRGSVFAFELPAAVA
jgi:signal transduction histidine kinase